MNTGAAVCVPVTLTLIAWWVVRSPSKARTVSW